MKSGLEKLLNTGRDLVENPDQSDLSDPDTPSQPIVGDFSSHDLIHGNVADPPSFDEPNTQNPPSNDIIIVLFNYNCLYELLNKMKRIENKGGKAMKNQTKVNYYG